MAEAASWFIEPLARHHNRAAFSCGNEALDRYLKEIARQDARRHVAAPFVLIEQSSPKTILGYYTLPIPSFPRRFSGGSLLTAVTMVTG